MKELERTNRISVSAVLFLLIILIGLLTFKKPEYVFEKNAKSTLNEIMKNDYSLTLEDLKAMNKDKYVLIDTRDAYDYHKGHLKGAVNITPHQVFNKETKNIFRKLKNGDKTIILYGKDPDAADQAWMLLYQLGYENIKILCIETQFTDNKFIVKNKPIEKAAVDFAAVMEKAANQKPGEAKPKPVKKVITVKKKKKRVAEGGC